MGRNQPFQQLFGMMQLVAEDQGFQVKLCFEVKVGLPGDDGGRQAPTLRVLGVFITMLRQVLRMRESGFV